MAAIASSHAARAFLAPGALPNAMGTQRRGGPPIMEFLVMVCEAAKSYTLPAESEMATCPTRGRSHLGGQRLSQLDEEEDAPAYDISGSGAQ